MDRVVHCKRTVVRQYPTWMGWTDELLKKRQEEELKTGKFGMGFLVPPFEVPLRITNEPHQDNVGKVSKIQKKQKHNDEGMSQSSEVKFVKDFMNASKILKDATTNLINLLKHAPNEIRRSDCFKIICDVARKATGNDNQGFDAIVDHISSLSQSMPEENYINKGLNDALESLQKATQERKLLDNRNEFPSFSPGFSDNEVSQLFFNYY